MHVYWVVDVVLYGQASIIVPRMMTEVTDKLARLLLSRLVPGERPINIRTSHMRMVLASNAPQNLLSAAAGLLDGDDAQLTLPADWCIIAPSHVDCTSRHPISVKVQFLNVVYNIGQQNIIMNYRKKLSLNSMSPQDIINPF